MKIVRLAEIYQPHLDKRIKLICKLSNELTHKDPYHILSQTKRISANIKIDDDLMIQLRISLSSVYPRLLLKFYGTRNSHNERKEYRATLEVIRKQFIDEGVL